MAYNDLPGIMFVKFFREKYLLATDKIHNGNTRPPALCAGEAPDEKLKINELGPYVNCTILRVTQWSQLPD